MEVREDDPRRVMRPAEIAKHWGCSTKTVYRAFKSGLLKKIKIGPRLCGAERGEVLRAQS
jgi:predicted DNA-binding transcriptional regulator AlpA